MVGRVDKRPYDTSNRQDRSALTRQRIVDAARELIVEHGYGATTVSAVARAANVHVDTVYQLVGRKPQLITELIEQALSGTDHAVEGEHRAHVTAMRAFPRAADKLRIYAKAMTETHVRLAPLFLALRDASAADESARVIWRQISNRRAMNMRRLVGDLAETGELRSGLTADDAADTIWATNSPELYVLLTVERGWTTERYEQWLTESWTLLLLARGARSTTRRRGS